MTAIDTGNPRTTPRDRKAARRRANEWLVLAATSFAFLFALGVAVGLISG